MKLSTKTKSIFLDNYFFYKIYHALIRRHVGQVIALPNKNADLYFDGYPRSGNTYTLGLIRLLGYYNKVESHYHAIAVLKYMLSNNVNTMIIIRNPLEAISSFAYTRSDGKISKANEALIEEVVIRYLSFYEYVAYRLKELMIINFDMVKNNETIFLSKIAKALSVSPLPSEGELQLKFEIYQKEMKSKEDGKKLKYSSLPNAERQRFKNSMRDIITKHPKFQECENIYQSLSQESILAGTTDIRII